MLHKRIGKCNRLAFTNGDHRGAVLISAGAPNRGKYALAAQGEDQSMTATFL